MSNLATFRTAVLALLDDPSLTRFTNLQVDQALRSALNVYTTFRPLISTYNLDCDGNGTMELPADFTAMHITRVQLYEADIDDYTDVTFYAWKQDEAWFIQTTAITYAAGEVLIITYSTQHTIDDLDSAAGTTIPAEDEVLLQNGAAGYASLSRSIQLSENNNLSSTAVKEMIELSKKYITSFLDLLNPKPSASFAVMPSVPKDTF